MNNLGLDLAINSPNMDTKTKVDKMVFPKYAFWKSPNYMRVSHNPGLRLSDLDHATEVLRPLLVCSGRHNPKKISEMEKITR